MNTNLNLTESLVTLGKSFRAVAFLCCLGALASCDKEATTVQPDAIRTETPTKNLAPTAKASPPSPLDHLTQELKTQGADWETRNQAIKVVKQIGEQKQTEAIPSLLDGMFVIQPLTVDNVLDYAATYPCTAALVQIGEPAVPQIQSRFLVAPSNVEQLVLLDTLMKIKGPAFVAEWIDKLPKSGARSLPEQRRTELKQWALSQK